MKTGFANDIFQLKYAKEANDSWGKLSARVVHAICGTDDTGGMGRLVPSDAGQLRVFIEEQKFIPGGRYLYYAGRPAKYYNNCYLLRANEDTREEWAELTWRAMA